MLPNFAPKGSPVEWSDGGLATGPPAAARASSPGPAGQSGLGVSPSPSFLFAQPGLAATGHESTLDASQIETLAGASGGGIMPLGAVSGHGVSPGGGSASGDGTSLGGGAASGYGMSAGATQNPYSWGSGSGTASPQKTLAEKGFWAPSLSTGVGHGAAPIGSGFGPGASPLELAGGALLAAAGPINQEQASKQLQQHQAQIKQAQEQGAQLSQELQVAQSRIDQLQTALNEQSLEEQDMQKKLQELLRQEGTIAQSSQQNQSNHQYQLYQNESQASEFNNIHQQRIQNILNNLPNANEHRYGPDGVPISRLPPDYPFSCGQPGLSTGQSGIQQMGQSGTQLPGQSGADQAEVIAHQPGSLLTEAEIRQEQNLHSYEGELRQNLYQQSFLQQQLDGIEAQEQSLKANENLTPQQREQVKQQLLQIENLRRQFKQNQALLQQQQMQLEALQEIAARSEREEATSTTYLYNDGFMTHSHPVDQDRNAFQAPLAGADPFLAHGLGMPQDRHANQAPVAADPFMAHGPGLPLDANAQSQYPVAADPMMDHGWNPDIPPVQDRRKDKDVGVAADPFMVHRVPVNADRRTRLPVAADPFLTHWLSKRPIYDAMADKRANMYPLAEDPFMTHNRYPAGESVPEYIADDMFLMKGQRPNITANIGADPFLTKDTHMRKSLKKDPFLTRTVPNDKNRCAYEDLKLDPLLSKVARLQVDVQPGSDKLEVDSTDAFRVNMAICINPGGANEEICVIKGFGSILLQRPLKLGHEAGEAVVPVVQAPHYTFQERVDQVVTPACRMCDFGMVACFGKMGRSTKRSCSVCGSEIGTVPTEFYFQPWLVFTFFLFSGLAVGHFYPTLNKYLVIHFSILCVIRIVVWFASGRCLGTLNRANMALMCLFATIAAVCVANMFWSLSVRQWWWLRTGVKYDAPPYNSATQSALSRADAAWLQFQDGSMSYPPSLVDTSRSAGYVDGSVYCVAPILNSDALSTDGSLTLVQYWALGINCCEQYGSFTCGASRSSKGKYGVVMVGNGGPCGGCSKEKFAAAITKAEAFYGLVSAEGALMVKWVDDPNKEMNGMTLNLILSVIIVLLIAVWVAVGVAWILFRIEKSIWDRQPRAGNKLAHDIFEHAADEKHTEAYDPFTKHARVEVMKDLRKLDSMYRT